MASTSPTADVETRTNGRTTYWARRSSGRRSQRVPTAPVRRRRRRRRRSTVAAVLATAAYAGAVVAAYLLIAPALRDDAEATPKTEAAAPPATAGPATEGSDLVALRTLAARAQRSVFVIEGSGVQGSGFIAWAAGGRAYLITARTLVAGVLRDGGDSVFVRRGGSVWEAEIAREDVRSGLALLRAPDGIGRPLWARGRGNDSLKSGEGAVIVPAGPGTPLEEAPVGDWRKGAFLVDATSTPFNVGAPVIGQRGKVAGVVVGTAGGAYRVVPLGRACGRIRICR